MAKNHAANIGKPTVQDVTEDATTPMLFASGSISISDADSGQAFFLTTVTPAQGDLGALTIAADGSYTYSVQNSLVQYLGAGDTKVDTFIITSQDGTTKQVSFTIHGVNDLAVIGAPTVHDVFEDANNLTLTATGSITVVDPDQGQSSFKPAVKSAAGNLGTLTISKNGSYTYTVANSATQYLSATESKIDTFTVTSSDGTTKQVAFTIHGANDAAVIAGTSIGSVTEAGGVGNATPGTPTATGTLTDTDVDNAANTFTAAPAGSTTDHGYGTYQMTAAGVWTYTLNDSNATVQALGAGQSTTDTFSVTTIDGTPRVITVTIHGANDAAGIGGVSLGDVSEDVAVTSSNLTTGGALTVSDVDAGQAQFAAQAATAGNNGYGTFALSADGHWTYTTDNTQAAIQHLGATQSLSDRFTAVSLDGTSSQIVTVTIHGTQDAPTLSVVTVTGNEDTAIPLSISSALIDTSPTESLSLTVAGVPAGATLNNGTVDLNGVWHLAATDLSGLTITPGSNFSGSLSLTVTATSTEGGSQLSNAHTLTVNVAGVADAPTLTGSDISVYASSEPIALGLHLAKTDGSETLGAVTISGVTGGYVLSSGTVNSEDGTWVVAAGDVEGLTMQPGSPGVGAFGNFNLHVTATSIDGASIAATSIDLAINIAAGPDARSGRAFDGYVSGATVFADTNGNGMLDAGEASTTTAADGTFTLNGGSGNLVMVGGTDVSTGLAFLGTLSAPSGSTVITPLTTLVVALAASSDPADVAAAEAAVTAAFGLDPSIDLQTFDPVAAAAAGDPNAIDVLAAGIQVQTTIAQISAAGGSATTQADVVSAVANSISDAAGGTVDLTNTNTLSAIIQDAAPSASAEAIDAVSQVVAAANDAIATAASGTGSTLDVLTNMAQTATVALGQTTDDLAQAGLDTVALGNVVTNNTGTNLTDAIALAPVGDPDGSQVGTLGNDIITGAGGNDTIEGLDGNDTLSGLGGTDTISGGNGADIIFGGDGDDKLYGGDGKDRLTGGAGNDLIDGGGNYDRAVYTDATGSITVNLAAGTVSGAGVGTDTLVAIEGVTGSDYNDTFDATGFTGVTGIPGGIVGNNDFEGGKGDDHIIGLRNLSGQALTRVSYYGASDSVTVDIQAGTADGTLPGDVAAIGHDTFGNVNGVAGSAYDDILRGSDNAFGSFEYYEGRRGNDFIDGRGGYDIVIYANDPATAAGITVHLAAGTVIGDATVGTDTLRAVEAVRGTNFDDTFDATGFGSAGAANIGSSGTFNDFQGAGGNDRVIGNGNTRVNYANAAGAMLVDLQTVAGTATSVVGTATGVGEGTDTLTGVNAAQGSSFGDTLLGSNFNNTLTGLSGDDYLDGRGGFDVASYNSLTTATGGVNVNLAAGTATGLMDGSIGNDTLRSIEGIQGTGFIDHFDATNYGNGAPTTLNFSNSNGSFNQFEGLGGDDIITGNGNTRIGYFNATAGVTVVFTGSGTGTADGNSTVDHDIFTGVNSVTGSGFADTIGGDGNSNTLTGGGGNDTLDGGGGADLALFTGLRSAYTISLDTPGAGQTTVTDSVAGRDGTDTLTNIEILQFSDSSVLIASGDAATPVNVSDGRLFFGAAANPLTTLSSSTSDDYLKIGFSLSGHLIDLGAGADDTIFLGPAGGYTLKLANVEHVVGTNGNDNVTLSNTASGLSFDLGAGTDTINLAAGINSIADAPGSSLFINGTASQDSLTFLNTANGQFVDLGAGGNDTLVLTSTSLNFITVANIENVVGSAGVDYIVIANTAGSTTVTGGLGVDQITASAGQDNFRFTSAADSVTGAGDHVAGFNAANDTFTFSGMTIAGDGTIQYNGAGNFAGGGQASAHLQNVSPGNDILQIDINGDGQMTSSDIEINLANLTGTLNDSHFLIT